MAQAGSHAQTDAVRPEAKPQASRRVNPSQNCPVCGHKETSLFLEAPDRFHGRSQVYQLRRCGACSLVWLHNPPRPQEMAEHYSQDYDRKIAAAGESSPQRWRDRRETLVRYKQRGTILDLGCSSGSFLGTLEKSNWELYGIEMSTESAQRARERTGAKVFVGDILDAPYPPNSFDVITCFHVFEHLSAPKEILEKVYFWLKPGGIFYALMPNIDSAGKRVFKSHWYPLELPRHLFHFSPHSLRNVAISIGLKEVSLTTDREVFVEYSTGYILDNLLKKIGVQRIPLSARPSLAFPWRVLRKAFRLTLLPVIEGAISLAGDGESIHAVFSKGDVLSK